MKYISNYHSHTGMSYQVLEFRRQPSYLIETFWFVAQNTLPRRILKLLDYIFIFNMATASNSSYALAKTSFYSQKP